MNANIYSKVVHHLTFMKYWPWELSVPLCLYKYDEDAPRQDRESGTGIAKKRNVIQCSFLCWIFIFIPKWRTSWPWLIWHSCKKISPLDIIWTFVLILIFDLRWRISGLISRKNWCPPSIRPSGTTKEPTQWWDRNKVVYKIQRQIIKRIEGCSKSVTSKNINFKVVC